MSLGEGQRESKHRCFWDTLSQLTVSVKSLERLCERIEGKDFTKVPSQTLKEGSPSLSEFLEKGHDRVVELSVRITEAVERLENLLF